MIEQTNKLTNEPLPDDTSSIFNLHIENKQVNKTHLENHLEKVTHSEETSNNNSSHTKSNKLTTNDKSSAKLQQASAISNTTSKSKAKQLSFFHSIDDSDENSNSSDSIKVTKDNGHPDQIGDKNVIFLEKSSNSRLNKPSAHKVASVVESDDHDDASSTSSCSCEEHSSVADNTDDDPHGDLDYDEDSIAGSPINNNVDFRNSTEDQLDSFDAAKQSALNDNQNLVSERVNPSSNPSSITDQKSTRAPSEDIVGQNDHILSLVDDDDDDVQKKSSTRIKSFINFQREEDKKSKVNNILKGSNAHSKTSSKDKSHKSYAGLLKYFFRDACYFQIKSINHENVEISKRMGVWSTPIQNELRLNAAFRENRNVILIFSVQQSGSFQGFARIVSEASPTNVPVPWVIPERLSRTALGGVFNIEWLCTKELAFPETRDLYNPLNNNKPVKVARDGQQVDSKIGKKLCALFPRDSKPRLLAAIETLKRQTRQKKQSINNRNIYHHPLDEVRVSHHNHPYLLQHPTLNGYDGSMAHPAISHLVHDHFYPHAHQSLPHVGGYRGPISRRHAPNHLGPPVESIYPPHNQFPTQRMSSHTFRRGNMRHIDGLPIAGYANHNHQHHQHQHQALLSQIYPYNDANQTIGYDATNQMQFNNWMPVARINTNRFQPYLRSRR